MSDQKILVQILEQQKKTNELLQAIVSSQEQLTPKRIEIFKGLSFDRKSVSFAEYANNYDDYVRRCSI
ncbi:MAG: hypothetical protein RR936_06820 [Carnobacterium sp.]|uniref:hypothetical protein n=1 Tax=Carnobacterium sp. TaxID=48221 RepID=UPI002FC5853B